MHRFLAITTLTMLTACAGVTGNPVADLNAATATPADNLQKLAAFTHTDLMNADADAVANNDAIAHACYPALDRFVTELQGTATGTVSGAFSAFQRGRDLANKANAGLPAYLTIGCAPLFVDANAMIARMAALAPIR
jgi:hypothetical protein